MPYRAPLSLLRVVFVMTGVFMLLLCTACHKTTDAPAVADPLISGSTLRFGAPPRGIRVEPVAASVAMTLRLPGRLAWNEDRTVRIFSPFAGRVLRALVQPGDTVVAGQALAELASPDFAQARAEAGKAAADLSLAEKSLRRAQELHAAGILAEKDVDAAQADFQRAASEHHRAHQRLTQVGAGDGVNFVLRAPIGGVVVDKAVNPGQEVRPDQPGAPLFVLSDVTQLWLWLDAAESDLTQLRGTLAGKPLTVTSAAYPQQQFTGTLVKSADFIDPVSRTFKLRATVDNARRELKAEMFVNAALPLAGPDATLSVQTVATSAVVLDGDHHYVFVATDDKTFRQLPVRVVHEQQGTSTVTGLEPGQRVVTEGALYLQQSLASAAATGSASAPASTAAKTAAAVPQAKP